MDARNFSTVLLISSQRSQNIGDLAMRQSAMQVVAAELGVLNPKFEVLGPAPVLGESPIDDGVEFYPIADSLSPLVKHLKHAWVSWAGKNGFAHPGASPNKILAAVSGIATRFVIYLFLFKWLLLALIHRYAPIIPLRQSQSRLFDSLQTACIIISTGGGWLNSQFLLTLYEQLFILIIAGRLYGIPIFLAGEQVGPLTNTLDRFFVRIALSSSCFVGTREAHSQEYADKLMGKSTTMLFGDWAYRRREPSIENTSVLRVGINLRQSYYSRLSDSFLTELANELKSLSGTHTLEVHSVPTCQGNGESDLAALNHFFGRLMPELRVVSHSPSLDPEECQRLVGSMDFNIGVSYHFCLFSLMSSTPCMGVMTSDYYKWKLSGLFELFDRPTWLVDFSRKPNLRVPELESQLHGLFTQVKLDQGQLRRSLAATNSAIELLHSQARKIFSQRVQAEYLRQRCIA